MMNIERDAAEARHPCSTQSHSLTRLAKLHFLAVYVSQSRTWLENSNLLLLNQFVLVPKCEATTEA